MPVDKTSIARMIAALLSLGGCVWAFLLMCLGLAAMGGGDLSSLAKLVIVFGVGFTVWFGWILRAINLLPNFLISWFWASSACVNLAYTLLFVLPNAGSFKEALLAWWWPFTATLSLLAFLVDRNVKTTESAGIRKEHLTDRLRACDSPDAVFLKHGRFIGALSLRRR